ncbi:unnamed protein product [Adineta steineri]|uniref:Uncharacterized protein n=1 Tax=Adineta steineri TaxID=433720 RepID=A0A818YEZ3_9BILA|nr:unnamed protein product [Adineta steineri]CAF3749181.1 unnamed protein product [Adineta steineri]
MNSNRTLKWLLIGDDDTLWFIPNLIRTLNEYDYRAPIYLGDYSDSREALNRFGNYYAYGGGGIAFSRPVAQRLISSIPDCDVYKDLFGGDMILGKCVNEKVGTNLTRDDRFHQMDINKDATGYFESGIQGLVSIHHMFSWWSLVPGWMSIDKIEILHLFYEAYQTTSYSYLKRYVWIDSMVNKTLVLTLGYSVTIYNQSLSLKQIDAIELTFCCSDLIRKTRPVIIDKKTWYFRSSFSESSKTTHLYQNSAPGFQSTYILVTFH